MPSQNDVAREELIILLRQKNGILMVGAGTSKFAGYPLWPELIEEMRSQLIPGLAKVGDDVDLTAYADRIKDGVLTDGRSREYYKFLDRKFRPKPANNHTPFHCALVQLGFSGIITTNYEIVIETAVSEAFSSAGIHRVCEPIDLCEPKSYRVFDFLRSISPDTDHRWILHLHGLYRNPEQIILTRTDYLRSYGEPAREDSQTNYGVDVKPSRSAAPPQVMASPLDTLHRKVIWALLAMRSVVFVGFSMRDEFFMRILEVVQTDFQLDVDPAHFAIVDYTTDEDKERTTSILLRKGVRPVFYHVPRPADPHGPRDYSGLEHLILELADSVGVPTGSPSSADLSRRMLER